MKNKKCSKCGSTDKNIVRGGENPLCRACYYKSYVPPQKVCTICGEMVATYCNSKYGPICKKCYNPPKRKCYKCGVISQVAKNTKNGPICKNCYSSPKEVCSKCGNLRRVSVRAENNIICASCRHMERYNDRNYRYTCILRERVRCAFKSYSKNGKVKPSKKYKINYEAIIEYLGKCPGNREDYHIDHIIPLSAFDLDDPTQVKAAFAPENHQWLPKLDNLKKKDRVDKDVFEKYIKKNYTNVHDLG